MSSRSHHGPLLHAAVAVVMSMAVNCPDGDARSAPAPARPTPTQASSPAPASAAPDLASAPRAEREALRRLLAADAWPKRAVAAMRLERYGGAERSLRLEELRRDPAWQVRVFALRTLGRQREPAAGDWFDDEHDPRVLRAALRHGYTLDLDRLRRGIRHLSKARDLDDRMLAAELAAGTGHPELERDAKALVRTIILRMTRHEAGGLAPRLAVLTGEHDLRRAHRWRRWFARHGRTYTLRSGRSIPDEGSVPPSSIARLAPARFAALESYLDTLGERTIDLAVCLDCTASMSGEIEAAQAGIDDLLVFVGDVSASFRFGLVAYRDRRERFETKAWEFTSDLDVAREHLWSLSAEGGGDSRELVYPAMRLAITRLSWRANTSHVLVVIGDAPPHVGHGTKCRDLARHAAAQGLVTHTIQTEGTPVDHFAEIAAAGNGECVSLADDHRLVPEIVGLTVGDAFIEEFRELFSVYLELCR